MRGIIIEWPPGTTEYLDDIDPNDLDNIEHFDTTKEWWPNADGDGGQFVDWMVTTEIEQLNGGVVVVVNYDRNQNLENSDLQGLNDAYWGTNRIIIEQEGQEDGNYCWTAVNGEAFNSKETKYGWKKKKLCELRNYRRSRQQIRDAKFRPKILSLDSNRCVISGETEIAALDVAHIIPARGNNNEILENGIALRADIHRLYDAKMFFIHPEKGRPKRINSNLSAAYKKLLRRGRLPDLTRRRVQEALRRVWPK